MDDELTPTVEQKAFHPTRGGKKAQGDSRVGVKLKRRHRKEEEASGAVPSTSSSSSSSVADSTSSSSQSSLTSSDVSATDSSGAGEANERPKKASGASFHDRDDDDMSRSYNEIFDSQSGATSKICLPVVEEPIPHSRENELSYPRSSTRVGSQRQSSNAWSGDSEPPPFVRSDGFSTLFTVCLIR